MNSFPFVTELLRVADLDEVMAIEQEAFSAPWSANLYRHEITRNELGHYLALRLKAGVADAGLLLGYAGFWLLVDEAHISTIAIRSGWRGYGLGEWLLLALLQEAVNRGAREATLEVRVSNRVAQGLYRKLGFQVVGHRKRYYSDNGEDALIMTLPGLLEPRVRAALAARREAAAARLRELAARLTEGKQEVSQRTQVRGDHD